VKVRGTAVLVLALIALCALAACIAACGSSSSNGSSSADRDAGTPVKGGSLRVTYQGEPAGLDPAIAWDVVSWPIERLTYETFLTYASRSGDAGSQLAPSLAIEVPSGDNGGISADGKTYTFKLRHGVKFAPPMDREVTAQDFKWSFERMMAEPLAPARYFYTGIVGAQDFMDGKAEHVKGFKVVDDGTVRITLEHPDGAFLQAMTLPFTSVMPKEWAQKVGTAIARRPLGTGPFVVKSWTPGRKIVAKRNPNYWDAGKPYLDEIEFGLAVQPSAAVSLVQRGRVDVMGDAIPTEDYAGITSDPTWSKYVDSSPEIAYCYVFMNVLEKPWDDLRVRQAVNFALDTAELQTLLAGQVTPLDQIYPAGMPGHDPSKQYYTHDVDKARQLLAEAGFPNGFTTAIYGPDADPFRAAVKSVQSDLAAVGIVAEVELIDWATYWDWIVMKGSRAGIGLADWYGDFPDPGDWIGNLYSDPIENGNNPSFWESAQVDALYDASNRELDPEKRIAMFEQMQDIVMREAPSAPLYQPVWNGLRGTNVGGYYYHPVWQLQFQEMWKLDGR
jgi:oligopeptide transport system substrate-binding protein